MVTEGCVYGTHRSPVMFYTQGGHKMRTLGVSCFTHRWDLDLCRQAVTTEDTEDFAEETDGFFTTARAFGLLPRLWHRA